MLTRFFGSYRNELGRSMGIEKAQRRLMSHEMNNSSTICSHSPICIEK